jgi:ubiquinone/menaquinone biosynthesis C-methylase UbiE
MMNQRVYREFAWYYHAGSYPQFSRRVARMMPAVFRRFRLKPESLLDVACGEGTFACTMANRGLQVTGLDQSPAMLEFARKQAVQSGARVRFVRGDMRNLGFDSEFDVVTCWFDALNYILQTAELRKVFAGVRRALRPGGVFLMDMNTRRGLAIGWVRSACSVQEDRPNRFELHRPSFNARTGIASLHITGFRRVGRLWKRMDEVHGERAYPLSAVRRYLAGAGFSVLGCYDSLDRMTPAAPDSTCVWLVARRRSVQSD